MIAALKSRKLPSHRATPDVTVGTREQLKVTLHLSVRPDREERLLLERSVQHRLLICAELANLVEEQHAQHTRTQMDIIARFLGASIRCEESAHAWRFTVSS
jgi:hypothetical protein